MRERGDDARSSTYTQRFDHPAASAATLAARRPVAQTRAAAWSPNRSPPGSNSRANASPTFTRVRSRPRSAIATADLTEYAFLARPLDRIGAYVPGGTRIAAVDRVDDGRAGQGRRRRRASSWSTPPQRDGSIDPAILYACSLCEVDELYAAGGAQAVAALAYGTATIAPVDKIVGPGNVYVTEAKRQVFGACGIDGLAGPSEVLVVCDERARPEFVAGELIAQAEHDPLARVAAVSRDRAMLDAVAQLLTGEFARETGRGEIVAARPGRAHLARSTPAAEAQVFEVIDRFAPEHLSLQVADPWRMVPRIRHAGAIFVGDAHAGCGRRLHRRHQPHAADLRGEPLRLRPAHR